MFILKPELRASLESQFKTVTANVNMLTPRSAQPEHGVNALERIAATFFEAHEAFDKSRKEQRGIDPESKAIKIQLARMYNSTTSLIDIVKASDASSEDIVQFKEEISKLLKGFVRAAGELEAANAAKERRLVERSEIVATPDDDAADIRAKERRAERDAEELKHDRQVLERFNRYRKDMPTKDARMMGSKQMTMFEMPVIPLVDAIVNEHQLKSIGLDSENVGMYTIILKQRILAVNPIALKAEKRHIGEFIQSVLKNLSERKGAKWALVAEEPTVYKNLGLQFFWIMEMRKLTRLTQLMRGGVDHWGFPFELEARVMKGKHGVYVTDTGPKEKVHVPERQSERKGDDGKINTVRDGVPRWIGRSGEA